MVHVTFNVDNNSHCYLCCYEPTAMVAMRPRDMDNSPEWSRTSTAANVRGSNKSRTESQTAERMFQWIRNIVVLPLRQRQCSSVIGNGAIERTLWRNNATSMLAPLAQRI